MKQLADLLGGIFWVVVPGSHAAAMTLLVLLVATPAPAVEGLYINEVIADNSSTPPADVRGGSPDMIELYNDTDQEMVLGGCCPNNTFCMSDTPEFPTDLESPAWCFLAGTVIPAKGYLVIFCDGNLVEGFCENHASFQLDARGGEPVSLWGPQEEDGTRPLVDQIWLPPLGEDVSVGRPPPSEGLGPAPIPLEDVLDVLRFYPPGTASFGTCQSRGIDCFVQGTRLSVRDCNGAENGPGGNIPPRVERQGHSTNRPVAGEEVFFTVEVRDQSLRLDDSPDDVENKIQDVQIVYRVDGGEWQTVDMEYDAASGVCGGTAGKCLEPGRPLRIWTLWDGSIPGQPEGSRVEFYFRARDAEQVAESPDAWSTSPLTLCPEGVGPCDREFGPPENGCQLDAEDADFTCTVCESSGGDDDDDGGEDCTTRGPFAAPVRYLSCSAPFTYKVGYEPSGSLAGIVINEVVPNQTGLLRDRTQGRCAIEEDPCERNAQGHVPNCCQEDFIEILNTSSGAVDVSGLWLSEGPFRPERWSFPAGSVLQPGEHCIVWLDNDGGKCPDPLTPVDDQPCFWECPDPTNPATDPPEFHANFMLNADGDEVFLFDTKENGYGVIHGLDFEDLEAYGVGPDPESGEFVVPENYSFSLLPDGDRNGCWVLTEAATPRTGNEGDCPLPKFKRGDANADCNVDLSDGVFVLNFLFLGGPEPTCLDAADASDAGRLDISSGIFVFNFLFLGGQPPPDPGPTTPGPDPTEDAQLDCEYPACP